MVERLSPELYLKVNALFAAGIKLFPKRKREKMQETIKWKYSNAGKIQNFTFWALAKIHPHCLRILKSTGDHICLKFWTFRFDLRKKGLLQIRQQKRIFGNHEPQNVNLINLGKFSTDCSTRKNGSPGKIGYSKHGWVVIRTDEGAGSTVGTGEKIFFAAAHEKHVSKGFDRSG